MNRKKWLILLWAFIVLLQLIQIIFLHFREPERFGVADIVFSVISSFVVGSILILFLLIPLFDRIIKKNRIWQLILMIATGITYTLTYILLVFALPAVKKGKGLEWYLESLEKFMVFDFHNIFKNFLFLVAALYAFDFFRRETQWLTNKKDLEIELNQSKLSALKNQLQPHFLFNSLNGIVATIDENKSKAQKMLIGLSQILRTTLNTNFKKLNDLSEEQEFLLTYLNIEKMRYEDQLKFNFLIPTEARKLKVPALILQPLVENAIKHGFKGKNKLTIIIEASSNDKIIRIKNDGAQLNHSQLNGTGLSHVKQRLKLLQDGSSLKIFQKDNWVINEIQLS